jgi:hypothetical protein
VLLPPLCAALLALTAVALTLAADGGPRLVVTDEAGAVLVDIALTAEREWIIRWNHSVTGILVSDYYRFEGERMLLTASHTPAFDAGLGHIPGRGRVESDGSNGYWIRDIDEPVPGNAYLLRVGGMGVNHRIVHADTTYSLSELAAGKRVRLAVIE